MRKGIIILIVSFLFYASVSANTYIENDFKWHKMRVIKYDVGDEKYNFKIWVNRDYESTSFRELLEDNNWISWVNWVFFCPKSYWECWGQDFTNNERYLEWEKISKWETTGDRVVFWVDEWSNPFLFQTWKINPGREDDIYYWFSNHPLLLQDGESKISEYEELWLIDDKMTSTTTTRNFVCSNPRNTSIYFWFVERISLEDLAELLKDFGCYNALNLDAWWSSALVYNARHVIWPGRNVMDWIIIERNWLDTSQLINLSERVISSVKRKLSDRSYDEKIEFLDDLSKTFTSLRSSIYDKNSRNVFDLEWNITWYRIEMNSLWNLKSVYLINYINKLIYELENEYKIEYEQDENLEDMKDLLF